VALLLRRNGITRIRPLAAGLEGWRQRGFPLEPEGQRWAACWATGSSCPPRQNQPTGGIGSIGPLQTSQIGSSAVASARAIVARRSSTRSRATASITRYSFASSQPMFFGCRSGGLRCRPRASEDDPRPPGGLHHARGDCAS
jgi:hypothetical protein